MPNLVILMIEEEQPEGLSARKLIVETAKHNVLTAYSAATGIELLRRFPNVDAVLVHAAILERHPDLIEKIRAHLDGVPVILTTPHRFAKDVGADYAVDSYNPQELLNLLQQGIRPRQRG